MFTCFTIAFHMFLCDENWPLDHRPIEKPKPPEIQPIEPEETRFGWLPDPSSGRVVNLKKTAWRCWIIMRGVC